MNRRRTLVWAIVLAVLLLLGFCFYGTSFLFFGIGTIETPTPMPPAPDIVRVATFTPTPTITPTGKIEGGPSVVANNPRSPTATAPPAVAQVSPTLQHPTTSTAVPTIAPLPSPSPALVPTTTTSPLPSPTLAVQLPSPTVLLSPTPTTPATSTQLPTPPTPTSAVDDDDDDEVPRNPGIDPVIALFFDPLDYTANENNGTTPVTLTLRIDPPPPDKQINTNTIITADYLVSTEIGQIKTWQVNLAEQNLHPHFDKPKYLTFPISITIPDDNISNEPPQPVGLALLGATNATLANDKRVATLTINDDDQAKVQFGQPNYSVRENIETGYATVDVNLNAPSAMTVTVDYETINNGSAIAGSDYLTKSDTVTFVPYTVTQVITVPIVGDELFLDGNKTFGLKLLDDPISATLGSLASTTMNIIDCALPDAITAANTDTATGNCPAGNGDDTITLTSGVPYILTTRDNYTNGWNGLPSITSTITISGNGATIERSSAAAEFRIFHVAANGKLTLNNVAIRKGRVDGNGGGILNMEGEVIIVDSIVSNNSTKNLPYDGGGIGNYFIGSRLIITNSIISNNSSSDDTGGIHNFEGVVIINDSTISNNTAISGAGGGLHNNSGVITVTNTNIISNKSVSSDGGGVANRDGMMMIENSVISSNKAGKSGGGIYNWDSATLIIDDSTIEDNEADDNGGGVSNFDTGTLTVTNSTISNNRAIGSGSSDGGGLSNKNNSTATISESIIRGNRARQVGGGIESSNSTIRLTRNLIDSNTANRDGGGIGGTNFSDVMVVDSTIIDNSANTLGGGIYIDAEANLTVDNSTISSNDVITSGGGIWVGGASGVMTITNSTIVSNNNTSGLEGGLRRSDVVILSLGNSIVANNTPSDCSGTIISNGYNLDSDGTCPNGTGDLTDPNPGLGPLQDNGGPTIGAGVGEPLPTHALQPGSPAINAGDPAFTPPPNFDQRGPGFPRVVNGRIDIGAFEVQ